MSKKVKQRNIRQIIKRKKNMQELFNTDLWPGSSYWKDHKVYDGEYGHFRVGMKIRYTKRVLDMCKATNVVFSDENGRPIPGGTITRIKSTLDKGETYIAFRDRNGNNCTNNVRMLEVGNPYDSAYQRELRTNVKIGRQLHKVRRANMDAEHTKTPSQKGDAR